MKKNQYNEENKRYGYWEETLHMLGGGPTIISKGMYKDSKKYGLWHSQGFLDDSETMYYEDRKAISCIHDDRGSHDSLLRSGMVW